MNLDHIIDCEHGQLLLNEVWHLNLSDRCALGYAYRVMRMTFVRFLVTFWDIVGPVSYIWVFFTPIILSEDFGDFVGIQFAHLVTFGFSLFIQYYQTLTCFSIYSCNLLCLVKFFQLFLEQMESVLQGNEDSIRYWSLAPPWQFSQMLIY